MQDELYKNLDKFWQQTVDELIESLKRVNRYASGNTAQSIGEFNTRPVTIESNGFRITLGMPDYYEFIDEGVSGAKRNKNISRFKYTNKMPPIKAIRRFMINRGIVPSNFRQLRNSNTRSGKRRSADSVLNSMAYAIARKIFENGVKPTHFYSDVVNDKKLQAFETNILDWYGDHIIKVLAN